MKRQGVSLPWSGTREATVSKVSSSVALGPGPFNSIGFTERRVFSKSRASGMGFGQIRMEGSFARSMPPKAMTNKGPTA